MSYVSGSAATALRQATATPTLTLGAAVSVGDIIVIYTGHDTSASDTVPTDSLGNTYSFQGSALTDANFNIHRVATARVTTAGTPTITMHLPGTPTSGAFAAAAYSGRATSSWVTDFDNAEQATPATSADGITCPALTVSAGDDVIYFMVEVGGNQGVFSAGTGFTERIETPTTTPGTDFNVSLTDQLNVSAGSLTPVGTTSNSSRTVSFAISLASGGGAPVTYNATGSEGSSESGTPSVAFAPGIIYKLRW